MEGNKTEVLEIRDGELEFVEVSKEEFKRRVGNTSEFYVAVVVNGELRYANIAPALCPLLINLSRSYKCPVWKLVQRMYDYAASKNVSPPTEKTIVEFIKTLIN